MRRPILVSGILLITLLGAATGYYAGDRTAPAPTTAGDAVPLGQVVASQPQQLRKIPVPSDVAALAAGELDFRTQTFTVHQEPLPPVRLSVRVPAGWQKTVNKDAPGEVKFLDSLRERAVRVESGFRTDLTTSQQREKLVRGLESSQPVENDLRIIEQTDDTSTGTDGRPRTISTIVYTYIPTKTVRYVVVRWVATGGDSQATAEMSITGLPQDAKALHLIADQAAKSVVPED